MDFTNHPINRNVSNVNVHRTKETNVNVKHIQLVAAKLVDKFHDDKSFNFYCRVARQLSEAFIWNTLEISLTKNNPPAYFTRVCKTYMSDLDK